MQKVNSLSLGYVLFRITNDIERLPYPLAAVQAGGATALAESSGPSQGWRWEVFSVGAFIGIIWGLFYVVIPTISGIFFTETVTILPIPFIDLTVSLKEMLPASIMGIGTDLGHVMVGLCPALLDRGRLLCRGLPRQHPRQPGALRVRRAAHLGAGHVGDPHADR